METGEVVFAAGSTVLSVLLLYVSFALHSFGKAVREVKEILGALNASLSALSERVALLESNLAHFVTVLKHEVELRERKDKD